MNVHVCLYVAGLLCLAYCMKKSVGGHIQIIYSIEVKVDNNRYKSVYGP